MRYIGIIPARAGSKSLIKKNIIKLGGQPLITHTFDAALSSNRLDSIVVTTDDEDVVALALEYNISTPFRRPDELARDDTPMIEVMQHVLSELEDASTSELSLVLLQPTSPFRNARHIDEAIDLFEVQRAQCVVSVCEIPHTCHPDSVMKMYRGSSLMPYSGMWTQPTTRQAVQPLYARNGPAVLVASASRIKDGYFYGDQTFGYPMDQQSSIDINNESDLKMALATMKIDP